MTLTANRFCHVGTPIQIAALATNITEQATLTCPFPPPPLGIAPAALVSWPNDGDTHTLESTPDVHGPWSPLNATPTVQDGQVTFVAKTDSQHQFFRLHQP